VHPAELAKHLIKIPSIGSTFFIESFKKNAKRGKKTTNK
jgi:hypothetical protein